MHLPPDLARKTFAVAAAAAVLWLAAAVWLGWNELAASLGRFGGGPFLAVILLSCANYALRFYRWQRFLAALAAAVPARTSFAVYFASYVMVITPGKVGEVLKAVILRDRTGLALSRGLAAVLAERVYDFLAVLALMAAGMAAWPGPGPGAPSAAVALALLALVMVAARSRALRRRLVARMAASRHFRGHTVGLDEALTATGTLLAPGRGLRYLAVSILAWFCEAAGLWLVCRELAATVGLTDAVFVYGAATLAGSVSFLPGGLGGTEATIVLLLGTVGVPRIDAAATAFIVRLATLWLAVAVGLVVQAACRRELSGPAPGAPQGPSR